MHAHDTEATTAGPAGLSLLRFSGPDAASFLQGQITHDANLLADGRTMLAACNTPQGRVVAVLRLRQVDDVIYAAVTADIAAALLERLRRYVLRAKVRLAPDARALRPATSPSARGQGTDSLAFDWAPGRTLVAVDRGMPSATLASESAHGSMPPDRFDWNDWQLADIAAGLPQLDAATSGQFVAQMLNLDLLDAISFSKGCYTGQEIVARTQNLGRIKRRLLRYAVRDGAPPSPMAALHRDGTKVGEVLMAARGRQGAELLAVTNLDSRDLPLSLDDGRIAEPLPLPYAV